MDRVKRRLFATCHNEMMVVMDADSGKVLDTPAIGKGTDASAFDPGTGKFFGSLQDSSGKVIVNPGLWALAFRTDGVGNPDTLYFTAGSSEENHGLFGTILPKN